MNMNQEICNFKKYVYSGAFRKDENSLVISAPCKLNVTYGVTVWVFQIPGKLPGQTICQTGVGVVYAA